MFEDLDNLYSDNESQLNLFPARSDDEEVLPFMPGYILRVMTGAEDEQDMVMVLHGHINAIIEKEKKKMKCGEERSTFEIESDMTFTGVFEVNLTNRRTPYDNGADMESNGSQTLNLGRLRGRHMAVKDFDTWQ
ncbi:unnamed protein product [Lactuca virosa]|uniref:Uncharacterized protein n=1 Tax=Lactuca virosa TaxID=75947 RepID=A0AAU9NI37_9ASTR|nr:unnamed protein product [Lactuca virosa]